MPATICNGEMREKGKEGLQWPWIIPFQKGYKVSGFGVRSFLIFIKSHISHMLDFFFPRQVTFHHAALKHADHLKLTHLRSSIFDLKSPLLEHKSNLIILLKRSSLEKHSKALPQQISRIWMVLFPLPFMCLNLSCLLPFVTVLPTLKSCARVS